MTAPTLAYQHKLQSEGFVHDVAQDAALNALETRYWQLMNRPLTTPTDVSDEDEQTRPSDYIQGLYLWGDVGRGKTFLMDIFYQGLPDKGKLRLHFHHFMAYVHKEMRAISGQSDPLLKVANKIAEQYHVICFDEFFVSDIADAMILGQLFKGLFDEGVTLIATSNIPIKHLYWEGLQRQQFEQTIALLQDHCQELHLNGQADHRLTQKEQIRTYFVQDEQGFNATFSAIKGDKAPAAANHPSAPAASVRICNRDIPILDQGEKLIWFDFDTLCKSHRSQLDYMEIARQYDTIFLSGVPALGGEVSEQIKTRGTEDTSVEPNQTSERKISFAPEDDAARRFISLIDELYEQHKMLYILADVSLDQLYLGGALNFEFRRAFSRLVEMQSHQYLNEQQDNAAI